MSEDFDIYNGLSRRELAGGGKGCTLLPITATSLLRQIKWHVDEAPTKARLDDLAAAAPNRCPSYVPRALYEYELCPGEMNLMLPVLDPKGRQCDVIFYEVVTVKGEGRKVRIADVLEAIWNFYNLEDPSPSVVGTLVSLGQNGGNLAGVNAPPGAVQKLIDTVRALRGNLKVPQVELLGRTRRFAGLLPWGDGKFFVKLEEEARGRDLARDALDAFLV